MGSFLQLRHISLENTDKVMRAITIIIRAVDLAKKEGQEREFKREKKDGEGFP